MFRLSRQNRSSKSGERIDFKFSNFQAIQVPKGWDKLFVSVISVDTGKTIAKSGKASVRNGNCQWVETLSESIWISQDESIKALEECLFKFVVTMGSARSGILGEATVNMSGYMSSKASVPVLLPLKKCNYGTILQVKIHCLTPRTKLRGEESKDSSYHMEDQNADYHDMESKSNISDDSFVKNAESLSSKDLGSTSQPGELHSQETSFSASGSHHSFDSAEGSIGREIFSSRNDLHGDKYSLNGRPDLISSPNGSQGDCPADGPTQSNHSSFNSRVIVSGHDSQNQWQESALSSSHVIAGSALINAGSSKNLLEAAEATIEELRAEAKLWERNARKLMLDLDILRTEFDDLSRKQAEKDIELSAATAECDGLKKEVEHIKLMLAESMSKQTIRENLAFQAEGAIQIQKELEEEIRFHQESNANLSLQLKRSQESNIELVTVLQELEETIEKQKVEIENLSGLKTKFSDMESSLLEKVEENRSLLLQLQQLQESENKLQADVQLLDEALKDKRRETKTDLSPNKQNFLHIETEYKHRLSAKEEEIASLEAKISEALLNRQSSDLGSTDETKVDLIKEIDSLKEKLEELERDCNELTSENLELLFKLKDSQKNCMQGCMSIDSSSNEHKSESFFISESEVRELKSEIQSLQEKLRNTMIEKDHLSASDVSKIFQDLVEQLQVAFYHVKKPCYNVSSVITNDIESDISDVESSITLKMRASKGWADSILNSFTELNRLLEARIIQCEEVLRQSELEIKEKNNDVAEAGKKLEDYILKENNLCLSIQELERSNMELEANLDALKKELNEKRSATKNLEAVLIVKEEEIGILRHHQGELEAEISILNEAKTKMEENMEIVPRGSNMRAKCSELESQKQELEVCLMGLEEEKVQLSERLSGLGAQLKNMSDERESSRLQLENSKSVIMGLQDEIRRLEREMETEKLDLKQKLQDMQNQISNVQQECENLKIANQNLQLSAETLDADYVNIKKEKGLLKDQNLELHDRCKKLETELGEAEKHSFDYSKRIEVLEEHLSTMQENFVLKEKFWSSEMDDLLQENRIQKEKLVEGESLLDQMHLEKMAEAQNLQKEIERLTNQISAFQDEKERIANEISTLRLSKANLESALQEAQSEVKLTEDNLQHVRTEYESKIHGLLVEISTSRQNHELLMADHEKRLKLMGSFRSSEEKLKTSLNDLELKLTVSEYERQQLIEETTNLKVQLQKVAYHQDEIEALKSTLDASKFEKEKLESSLHNLSGDIEELKAEKTTLLGQISNLQATMSELEQCKCIKVELEEKILKMEGRLSTAGVLSAQNAELKIELSQIKRSNNQFQSKIQVLEEEKDKFQKRAEVLAELLKLMEQAKGKSRSTSEKDGHGNDFHEEIPNASRVDHVAQIQLLEDELAQALEARDKYKSQLHRLMSDERNSNGVGHRRSTAEGDVVGKDIFEHTKSSLERELRELRERYSSMSLKYAEVEAQKEDLVMKLKMAKAGKKWFS
ncbi:hypothetical protein NMG60_11000659 [Bertholletia excelsa]